MRHSSLLKPVDPKAIRLLLSIQLSTSEFEYFKRNLNMRYLLVMELTTQQTTLKCNKNNFINK